MRSCQSTETGELLWGHIWGTRAAGHVHLLLPWRGCRRGFRRRPRPRRPGGRSSTAGFDPRPIRAPSEPRLGRWVFLTLFVEVSQPAISGTVVCARLWVPSHETKADTLNHIALGAHASRHAMVRAAKGPEWRRQSTCRTAQTAISRGYAGKGQVPESTIGLVMRACGFGRCMTTCTGAIWRKKFGSDAHLSLSWTL